jgi:hypothetical protein
MTTRELIILIQALIRDNIVENNYFKILEAGLQANVRVMFDKNNKRLF